MAANTRIFPASLAKAVAQAVANTAIGGKATAGCNVLASEIGTAWRLRLRRAGVLSLDVSYQSAMTVANGAIAISGYTTLNTLLAADIDTGVWTLRIGRADDSAYIEGTVGPVGSSAPFILTGDLATTAGVAVANLVLRFDASIDGQTGWSGLTSDTDRMVDHMGPTVLTLPGIIANDANAGGNIIQGADLRREVVPHYWGGNLAITPAYWASLLPWYVMWDISGHSNDANARLAIKDMELWGLFDDETSWRRLTYSRGPTGNAYLRGTVTPGSTANTRREPDGSWSVRLRTDGPYYHGYGEFADLPAPQTLRALQSRALYRKIIDDPALPDTRALARYAVQQGLDAYPTAGARLADYGATYWPGLINSRFVEITNEWQPIYASSIDSAFKVYTGRAYNSRHRIAEAVFRAAPPPV